MNFKTLTAAYIELQKKSQSLHTRTKEIGSYSDEAFDIATEIASIAAAFAALDAEAEALTSGAKKTRKTRAPKLVDPSVPKKARKVRLRVRPTSDATVE